MDPNKIEQCEQCKSREWTPKQLATYLRKHPEYTVSRGHRTDQIIGNKGGETSKNNDLTVATNKIDQCSSCNRALMDGWVEMPDPLTGVWGRLCFNCGFANLEIQNALHADDLLAAGMMEDGDASLLRD